MGIAALCVGCLAAGCGSSGSTTAAARPTTMDWARLPVLGYSVRHTAASAERIVATTQAGIRARITTCVTAAGYQYESPRQAAAEQTVLLNTLSRAPSVRAARQRGLNLSTAFREPGGEVLSVTSDPEYASYLAAMSAPQQKQFDHQVSVCTNAALASLTEQKGSALRRLTISYRDEVLSTDVLGRAHSTWMSCMADRGHRVSSLSDLQNQLKPEVTAVVESINTASHAGTPDRTAVARLWHDERSAAIDQARCDIEAYGPVVGPWAALERRWERRHATDLATLNDQLRLGWASVVGL
jgi:hypothetical protein